MNADPTAEERAFAQALVDESLASLKDVPQDILRELRGNFVSELLCTESGRRRLKLLMPHRLVDESKDVERQDIHPDDIAAAKKNSPNEGSGT
jgi:hypothetical protein